MLPLLDERWPGSWIAPDLPGHGGSAPLDTYTFDRFASSMAEQVGMADRIFVLGHSLGGVIGVNMASSRFGVDVDGVVALGVKVSWSREDLDKARALSLRPVTWFDAREDAAHRFLLVSGLIGLVDPSDEAVSHGLMQASGRWRLALDPAAFAVGAPDMTDLLKQADAPVVLARGEYDRLGRTSNSRLSCPTLSPCPDLGTTPTSRTRQPYSASLPALDSD